MESKRSNQSRGPALILVADRNTLTPVQKQMIFALEQLLRCVPPVTPRGYEQNHARLG